MLKLIFREIYKNNITLVILVLFILLFLSALYKLPTLERFLHMYIIDKEFESIESFESSVLNVFLKNLDPKTDIYTQVIRNREILENILSTLNIEKVENVFLVGKDGDRYFIILDVSKKDRLPVLSPFQFMPEEERVIKLAIKSRTTQIITHENIDTIGMTIYKPVIRDGRVEALLVMDFSTKKLKEISQLVLVFKIYLISFITLSIMALFVIFGTTLGTVYYRKKSIIDNLTGVYNRNFLQDIQHLINLNDYIVSIVDVDFFKKINDTYGHDVGDKVLKVFSSILKKSLRKEDYIVRYGGEEFLIIVKRKRDGQEIKMINLFERIRENIESQRVYINPDDYIKITASIGVNMVSNLSRDLTDAIKKADIALYKAKAKGRNRVEIYDEVIDSLQKSFNISMIKESIEEGRVICHYQPIVDLRSGKISHYEALARMVEKDGSITPPSGFIDIIENTFLYTKLTKRIIDYNVGILSRYRDIKISINLKPADILNQPTVDYLLQLSDNDKGISERVMLEIVETEDILAYDQVVVVIEQLKAAGYKICIDDFGSGYSNFVYLLKLKVDYLKIDKNLITNVVTDEVSREIVEMINNFCRKMGISVIAEFVENEDILLALKKMGISYGQGYHLSAPKPIEDLLY